MGLPLLGRFLSHFQAEPLMWSPSPWLCFSPVALLFPVAIFVAVRLAKVAAKLPASPETALMTENYQQTDSIFRLLPRWRLHLSVISRWLLSLWRGHKDPTTGTRAFYWCFKADAYEQMAPKQTLTHIARSFGVESWKAQLNELLEDAANQPEATEGEELRLAIESLTPDQTFQGNSVRIPTDGVQAFEWRRRMIQSAKKRVLFMTAYMSVDNDARAIAADLCDCARRGVEVYVALDNFGADAFEWCGPDTRYVRQDKEQFQYADLIRTLRDSGAKLCFWRAAACVRARGGASGDRGQYELFDCKNHIKTVIVDSEVAILTDRNVGSAYFRNPAYSSVEVCLAGPCVVELEKQFAELWTQGGGLEPLLPSSNGINGNHKSEPVSKIFASLRDTPADDEERLFPDMWGTVLVSTPRILESGLDPILLALMLSVRAAKHSVDLMFAYMEICQPLREELVAAVRRGVAVRVVTNSRETNDLFWINAAFLQSVLPVVEAGGKLVLAVCTPEGKGHVHAKVSVIDGRFLLVGSWNAWLRSTLYEVEADVFVDHPPLASRVAQTIDELEASAAYQCFNADEIRVELAADPLGVDPAVVPFL